MSTPHCEDCGAATMRVVSAGLSRYAFLCASCEYLRVHPDVPRAVKLPRERKPLKLQDERLFEP